MISFFHQNKGKLDKCEDSLTSLTFDLLKYLPSSLFWEMLKKSLTHQKLPETSGKILEWTYWTKWDAENTTNVKHIEPDVFIRFSDFDLIIEAKRYDSKQQSAKQMQDEIISYHNVFGVENKKLFFLQMGGLHDFNDVSDFAHNGKQVVVCKTSWTRLLDQIVSQRNKLNLDDGSQPKEHGRIFDDLIKGFEMHGFFKKLWLNSLTSNQKITLQNLNLFSYASKH